jgi:ribonuclease T1
MAQKGWRNGMAGNGKVMWAAMAALCVALLATAQARPAPQMLAANAAATGNTVAIAQLPREAVGTLKLIAAGGPYPYGKDGITFGNYERALPYHRRGYYHEYTVPTPRARNRGARRIVCGGPLQRINNCFYTDDHYTSFRRIVE